MRPVVDVEVWSDVVCPWCYIGKRRFDAAVQAVADDIDVRVAYRPYQLDPRAAPGGSTPVIDAYARKFGGPEQAQRIIDHLTSVAAEAGIEFRMDRARRANTLLAHRLLWLTEPTGHQAALKERLLAAYFTDGLDVGDPEVLAECAGDVGLDAGRVLAFLRSDDGLREVRALLDDAAQLGITAVPTYVLAGRWSIPGAQDSSTFEQVLRRLAARMAEEAGGG